MPILDFVPYDSEQIHRRVIELLEAGIGETLAQGDERRIFAESALSPVVVAVFSAVNDGCRQKLVRYARGEYLDALGETWGVYRDAGDTAKTTLRFGISAAMDRVVVIPQGTRVTSDFERFFETTEEVQIDVGQTSVTVSAVATTVGAASNGIAIGGLNVIVDTSNVPYINSVTNTTVTAGGADIEDDESYRLRIVASSDAWTSAGTAAAYRYFAISADPDNVGDALVRNEKTPTSRQADILTHSSQKYVIVGVAADVDTSTLVVYPHGSTTPAVLDTDYELDTDASGALLAHLLTGTFTGSDVTLEYVANVAGGVVVTIIGKDGEIPTQDTIDKVEAALNAPDVKPLTDHVTVTTPSTHPFGINLTYYTTAADEQACVETVEGEGGAIDRYIKWQQSSLDRDVNPDYLRKLILAPDWEGAVGATMVTVTSPTYVNLADDVLAAWNGVLTVSHVVREGVN